MDCIADKVPNARLIRFETDFRDDPTGIGVPLNRAQHGWSAAMGRDLVLAPSRARFGKETMTLALFENPRETSEFS